LLLGVIGLAIGAGIASAFPSTKMEQDMMGEAGAAVKDTIQEIASETSERAKDVFVEVKKEAAAQGLTPAYARESLNGVVEKVKTAATLSQESLKDRLS
jgi:fatty acid-binding protein DegV